MSINQRKHLLKVGEKTRFKEGHNLGLNTRFKKGHKTWNKGTEGLMSTPWNKGKNFPYLSGENSGNWKGGKGKWWSREILKKDNYTCRICGMEEMIRGFMDTDHIKSIKDYPELRYDLNNGQTLCPNCHRLKALSKKDNVHKILIIKKMGYHNPLKESD